MQVINFLHECGVLLHCNDVQTKLSDLYFLDPEWLCMLMGQIITIKQINAFTKDGVSLHSINFAKHVAFWMLRLICFAVNQDEQYSSSLEGA